MEGYLFDRLVFITPTLKPDFSAVDIPLSCVYHIYGMSKVPSLLTIFVLCVIEWKSSVSFLSTTGGNRTRTSITAQEILSLSCLPIPSPWCLILITIMSKNSANIRNNIRNSKLKFSLFIFMFYFSRVIFFRLVSAFGHLLTDMV